MESTELRDIDFISNPFTEPTFFTPTTSLFRPKSPDSLKAQNEDEDEDEYVAELTRQMTKYMLQDDEKHQKVPNFLYSYSSDSISSFSFPILNNFIFFRFSLLVVVALARHNPLWSPFASCYSSPIGPSREPSPPLTPVGKIMTKIDTKPVSIPFQSKQALIDDQIRSVQANFQNMKKEKQRNDDVLKGRNYHQHQQRPRSGVKAVFVDGLGSKTGSCGTGVFLPRGHGTVLESRKKPGCSTVIIPSRVVEALKVHYDKLGVPSTFSSDIPPFHDALLVSLKNKNNKSNKMNSPSRIQREAEEIVDMSVESAHQEISPADLPHEWTY